MENLGLVAQSGLEVLGTDSEESCHYPEDLLVLYTCHGLPSFVRISTAFISSNCSIFTRLEFELADVQNAGQNLADFRNLAAGKFELAKCSLE